MKGTIFSLLNLFLLLFLVFFILNCDGVIRGEEKIFLRQKTGLLKEYEGECFVFLYSNEEYNKRMLLHKNGSQVKNGNLIYFFTVSPRKISYQMEIQCDGGIKNHKIVSFPEDSNIDFHKSLLIHEVR